MLPLLTQSGPSWTRAAFMIERRGGRGAQEELGDSPDLRGAGSFNAIRTKDYTFVQYGSGERELYDLRRDPHQLENIAGQADSAVVRRLSTWLAALAKCRGSQCQRVEDGTPQ